MTPVNPTTLLGLLSHVPDDQTAIIQPEQNIRITYGNLTQQVHVTLKAYQHTLQHQEHIPAA
jgi:hypothetical protein